MAEGVTGSPTGRLSGVERRPSSLGNRVGTRRREGFTPLESGRTPPCRGPTTGGKLRAMPVTLLQEAPRDAHGRQRRSTAPRPEVTRRPRLLTALGGPGGRPFAVLVAPAGYG